MPSCVCSMTIAQKGVKNGWKSAISIPKKKLEFCSAMELAHPSNRKITLDLVNHPDTTGKFLHRFSWLNDDEIGSISHEWNWLVDWYHEPQDGKPKAIHYTEGGPWFKDYRFCSYHEKWKSNLSEMMNKK